MDNKIKPSGWFYGLAFLILIVGIVLFVVFIFYNLKTMPEGLSQMTAPGRGDITLTNAGKYTVYYEYQSVVGGRVYSTGENLPSGLQFAVLSKETGANIPITTSTMKSSYSIGNRSGVSVFDFAIEKPGTYEITSWYTEGQTGPEVVITVGQGFAANLLMTVFGGIGICVGALVITLVIIIVTFVKRQKSKKMLQARQGQPTT
jgi:uncharacterized membrane protein